MQSERDKFIDTLGLRNGNLISTVDNLSSKVAQAESSLVVTETITSKPLKCFISLEHTFIAKNSAVEESVWRMLVYHHLSRTKIFNLPNAAFWVIST